jgi:predicted DNA-binding transcriptional regulator AlpA
LSTDNLHRALSIVKQKCILLGVSHHLVGVAEVAEMLGVSRQRVNQLVQEEADFPEPEATLAAGRIWLRSTIETWASAHPRRSIRSGEKSPSSSGGNRAGSQRIGARKQDRRS